MCQWFCTEMRCDSILFSYLISIFSFQRNQNIFEMPMCEHEPNLNGNTHPGHQLDNWIGFSLWLLEKIASSSWMKQFKTYHRLWILKAIQLYRVSEQTECSEMHFWRRILHCYWIKNKWNSVYDQLIRDDARIVQWNSNIEMTVDASRRVMANVFDCKKWHHCQFDVCSIHQWL